MHIRAHKRQRSSYHEALLYFGINMAEAWREVLSGEFSVTLKGRDTVCPSYTGWSTAEGSASHATIGGSGITSKPTSWKVLVGWRGTMSSLIYHGGRPWTALWLRRRISDGGQFRGKQDVWCCCFLDVMCVLVRLFFNLVLLAVYRFFVVYFVLYEYKCTRRWQESTEAIQC